MQKCKSKLQDEPIAATVPRACNKIRKLDSGLNLIESVRGARLFVVGLASPYQRLMRLQFSLVRVRACMVERLRVEQGLVTARAQEHEIACGRVRDGVGTDLCVCSNSLDLIKLNETANLIAQSHTGHREDGA